jgi:CBS domain-containing protein
MKVREIMTKEPVSCGPETNLAAATELMWNHDCGVLPVIHDGRLAGIVTDRDICIALGTRNRPAAELAVHEVATQGVETCYPGDNVSAVMTKMRRAKVRRMPVVSAEGELEGIVALNDLILAANRNRSGISYEDVVSTMKAVSEHRSQLPAEMEEALRPSSVPAAASNAAGPR